MTCDDITRQELMEQYLLGRLEQPARDAFDEHLFECEACFERLQTLRALRHELAATANPLGAEPERPKRVWSWTWAWAPTLAMVVVAGVIVWPRIDRSPVPPTPPGQPAGGTATTPPGPATGLLELGRFEAPPFAPGSLRGSQDAAVVRFRDGMTRYARGDHRGAIAGLREAARLDPEAAHATFFLGISSVLAGQLDEGIRALRQTIQLGDSPYLEEAHFYLAKALLQQRDPVSARQELVRTIELKGPLEQPARRLLADLDRGHPSRP
jgi:hypothetical protein